MARAEVAVIGAGLSGLTAAVALHGAGREVVVLEARPSVGGRTSTVVVDEDDPGASIDLGATWLWAGQTHVLALAADLGVATFPQYRTGRAVVQEGDGPPTTADIGPFTPAEFRLEGGAQGLVKALGSRLPEGAVRTGVRVVGIGYEQGTFTVATGSEGSSSSVEVERLVVALPPRLVATTIDFAPGLDEELVTVMHRTPTWMATALKGVAVYEEAFWRAEGLSGLAICDSGPLREVHDGGSADGTVAALWGFVSPHHDYRDLDVGDRIDATLAQLGSYFGPAAADPVRYLERNWSREDLTNDEVFWIPDGPLPCGDPAFARPLFGGRLAWAGAETVKQGGGHLEGAVIAGRRAAAQVLEGCN